MAQVTEKQVLERLREICLALPGTEEVISYGHPAFKASGRIYAVLEEYNHELSLCVKVGKTLQDVFLKDPRFYRTPYIGQQGWVSLKIHAAPLHWNEIRELLAGSHQIAIPERKPRAVKTKSHRNSQ
jgi:predicted DNA-binding protein (MmcQ/YjbR family)